MEGSRFDSALSFEMLRTLRISNGLDLEEFAIEEIVFWGNGIKRVMGFHV